VSFFVDFKIKICQRFLCAISPRKLSVACRGPTVCVPAKVEKLQAKDFEELLNKLR
jgi:hypothetical protein